LVFDYNYNIDDFHVLKFQLDLMYLKMILYCWRHFFRKYFILLLFFIFYWINFSKGKYI